MTTIESPTAIRLARPDPGSPSCSTQAAVWVRPQIRGKFLFVGDDKFYIKGITYGPFRPDEAGCEFGSRESVERDFASMTQHGFNTVRTYTVPPRWLLDTAQHQGLRVMVGLPWEQHITFLDEAKVARRIEQRVLDGVRSCAGHPALLAYTIGNEIPPSIVRWHGRRRIERFLHRLYKITKLQDPAAPVTYVNYPTTEYLQLPFVDFLCFNVYLESQDRLTAYLARLQNIAGERPLVMAEIGLDSMRNGPDVQSRVLDWQVRTASACGCAGSFVFSWTDDWYRGGQQIDDWRFGLTDRNRHPKLALQAVGDAFSETPFPRNYTWPRISVVVCSFNGGRTIRQCLEGLARLDYPDYEVVVVNDGSTDSTASVAGEFDVRLINLANGGLSNARNVGMRAATGEIVAYIDDDAYPDPHWLTYLAHTFTTTDYVGVGGPNIAPPGDGLVARCVANSPGGPMHVLSTDQEAEHIPGCNSAFRRSALEAVGGFDPQFRIAGDDVDLCWRLQENGGTLGYSPAAVVWHHRRNTVRNYLKQQRNYGKAEAMLEVKWPEKYNCFGHFDWKGRIYGNGPTLPLFLRSWRIYHGVWGTELFQSLYTRSPGLVRSLPLMPEWYLVVAALVVLTATGLIWKPLLLCVPLLLLAIVASVAQAAMSAANASFKFEPHVTGDQIKRRLLTAFLHLAQPLARLIGRLSFGLTPWRRRGATKFAVPRPRRTMIWSEQWISGESRLESLEKTLRQLGAVSVRGGTYDEWDLEVRGGLFGSLRIRMAIEEHGDGKQLVRLGSWPRVVVPVVAFFAAFAVLAALAGLSGSWIPPAILAVVSMTLAIQAIGDCASATATYLAAISETTPDKEQTQPESAEH